VLVAGPINVVRIAAFLACSWTWVIGMFLPILLVRDLGPIGWAIFAVPNVIGAAAMGWLVPSAEASRRMEQEHGRAMQTFAIVTIAFQVYFLGGLLPGLVGPWAFAGFGVALIAAIVPAWRRATTGVFLAPAVWLASLALIGVSGHALALPTPQQPAMAEMLGLGIACLFGFALCPYLDPTFHRARQLAGDYGRGAFGVGFGAFFLAMILGTLLYAPVALGGVLPALVGVHIVMQATYTVAVHRREMVDLHARTCGGGWRFGLSVPMFAGLAIGLLLAVDAVVVAAVWPGATPFGGFTLPELIYRGFLGFYGLLFPAYVWLMVVGRRGVPTRQDWGVYAAAVGLALPFFAVGFLGGSMIWVGVGMVPVMLARGFIRPVVARSADREAAPRPPGDPMPARR
jgi:hypothetical protein